MTWDAEQKFIPKFFVCYHTIIILPTRYIPKPPKIRLSHLNQLGGIVPTSLPVFPSPLSLLAHGCHRLYSKAPRSLRAFTRRSIASRALPKASKMAGFSRGFVPNISLPNGKMKIIDSKVPNFWMVGWCFFPATSWAKQRPSQVSPRPWHHWS